MIHDERKVPVFDLASRRTVGTLDESFVVGMIHPGSVFITKGQLWRVLDTEEGRITVEPAKRAKGELPELGGRADPGPVRDRAGGRGPPPDASLRRLHRGTSARPAMPSASSRGWTGTARSSRPTEQSRSRTRTRGSSATSAPATARTRCSPGSSRSSSRPGTARPSGSRSTRTAASSGFPKSLRAAEVREALVSLDPAHIRGLLELGLKRTALYKWKLVQVAKKFGAIDPDADYERLSIHRLSTSSTRPWSSRRPTASSSRTTWTSRPPPGSWPPSATARSRS